MAPNKKRKNPAMKIIHLFFTLFAMAVAKEVQVKAGQGSMGMKKKMVEIKCMKRPTVRTSIGYPEVADEVKLDFKTIAELKDEVAKKNQPAKLLSFADLKAKFGGKMMDKFKNMDEAAFQARKKVRVFRKKN